MFVAVFTVFSEVWRDGRVLVTAFSAFSIFTRFWLGWGVCQPISGSSGLSRRGWGFWPPFSCFIPSLVRRGEFVVGFVRLRISARRRVLVTHLLFFRTRSSLSGGAAFVAVFTVFFEVWCNGAVLVTAFSAFSIFSRF